MIWRYVVFSIGTYSSGDTALLVDILDFMHLQIVSDFSFYCPPLFFTTEYYSIVCLYELEARIANMGTPHELINEGIKIGF